MSDQLSKRYLNTGAAPVSPCASIQAQAAPREYPAIESAAAPVDVGGIEGYATGMEARDMHAEATLLRTLARQLAECEEDRATARRAAIANEQEAERMGVLLAATTRRVAEVEGLVGRWRQRSEIEASAAPEFDDPDEVAWHEGKASQLDECADELEAALQKEPK